MKNNWKRLTLFIFIAAFVVLLGCNQPGIERRTYNPTGEEILKQNRNADIFIFNDVVYINASNIQWVQNLDLTIGEKVGTITNLYRKGSSFTNGTSTKLRVNTNIYKAIGDRSDEFLLVKIDNKIIRYFALVEG